MTRVARGICLLFCLFIATASSASEMTEQMVTRLLSQVDSAVNGFDARSIAVHISDDATFTMNINAQGRTQILSASKDQYISMLQQGWSQLSEYSYNRKNVSISIVDNKATVTADVHESMIMQGQNVSALTQEQVLIEIVDGAAMITRVVGHVSL